MARDVIHESQELLDLSALLELPALWLDHDPLEIARDFAAVLVGALQLDAAYARFGTADGESALEALCPSSAAMPDYEAMSDQTPGLSVHSNGQGIRTVTVRVSLPWEEGVVLLSATRNSFPTDAEKQLIQVALGQAALAIHDAQRVAREHDARLAAEEALLRQNQLLLALAQDVEPSLASLTRRVHEVTRLVSVADPVTYRRSLEPGPRLTRRESEVLGLVAKGLSNKEIARTMWLSERTVERHITGLYRKIGVVRRSEATVFALRHGFA